MPQKGAKTSLTPRPKSFWSILSRQETRNTYHETRLKRENRKSKKT